MKERLSPEQRKKMQDVKKTVGRKMRRERIARLTKYAGVAVLLVLVIGMVLANVRVAREIEKVKEETEIAREERENLLSEQYRLQYLIDDLYRKRQADDELREILDQLLDLLSRAEYGVYELTAYAPLDPDAVEGMCYQGDPSVTSSGGKVAPWQTLAAGPGVPFGSRVFVKGYGWWIVNDRGEDITDAHLDFAVWTKAEAYRVGRRPVAALIIPPRGEEA